MSPTVSMCSVRDSTKQDNGNVAVSEGIRQPVAIDHGDPVLDHSAPGDVKELTTTLTLFCMATPSVRQVSLDE